MSISGWAKTDPFVVAPGGKPNARNSSIFSFGSKSNFAGMISASSTSPPSNGEGVLKDTTVCAIVERASLRFSCLDTNSQPGVGNACQNLNLQAISFLLVVSIIGNGVRPGL